MKVTPALVCVALVALLPAAYSQTGCATAPCCDYDYKASSESCCKFWVCNNGIDTEMTCPGGLHWNNVAKACDWPASANCGGSPVAPTPSPPTRPPPTLPPPTLPPPTLPPPTRPPTPEPGEPGGCTYCECTTGEYDAADGQLCMYRVCDNGRWTTMRCPPGTVWDNTRKTCG